MNTSAWRALAILCSLFFLGGCSTLVERHVTANQELIASCEALSSKAPPAPESLKDYLLALEMRAWPALASCPAAAIELEIGWSQPQAATGRVLVRGVGPLLAAKDTRVLATLATSPPGSTVTIGGHTYSGVRFLDPVQPGSREGVLKSARPAPVSLSAGGTVLSQEVPGGVSLIACGLAQGMPADPIAFPQLEALRSAISKVETRSEAAGQSWAEFRKFVRARESELRSDNRNVTYREWLFGTQGTRLMALWYAFEDDLRQLASAVEALDEEARKPQVASAWPALQENLLAFVANTRITLRKARTAIMDEGQILRDYAKARITENFALKYLNLVDRSLIPLERGFDKVDEQAYGLGSVAVFLGGNPFTDALSKSYVRFRSKLCEGGTRCATIWEEWDTAVARASCKRLNEPVDGTQAGMMMQYVYRFYARVGTGEHKVGPEAGVMFVQAKDLRDAHANAAALAPAARGEAPGQKESQLTQHALAEWTVRNELLARDVREQLRGAAPAMRAAWVASAPDESQVEAQAMLQAATQVVETWGQAAEGKASFAESMKVQNNITVSQQVAVKVVNQQTVINNMRIEATAPAAPRVRIAPGAVQVNVPITTVPAAKPDVPAPPQSGFCAGTDSARCTDFPTGFRWTISDYDPGSSTPAGKFSQSEYGTIAALVRQVGLAFPQRRVRIEVHGFASREPFRCEALLSVAARAEPRDRDHVPPCTANGNVGLSYLRAAHVRGELMGRLGSGGPGIAPPFPHGDLVQPSSRKVEVRVFADPA